MMPTANEIHSTTQIFLDIHDITNDILIKKDGSTALIITVNAMNFGLLAEEEQDAIIYSYAGLLNSLNYHIQIVIKSQTKDVTSYLHLLDEELTKSPTKTKRKWIKRYRDFVANLIKERNVLDKKFYVVIPASSLEMGLLPASTVIPGVKQPDLTSVERSVILDKAKEILEPKKDHLLSQFNRIGLIARQLTTQEIIQLFYLSYNPEAAEGQQITNTSSYTTPLVKASIRGGNMNDTIQPITPQPKTDGLTTQLPPTPTPTAPTPPVTSPVAPPTVGNVTESPNIAPPISPTETVIPAPVTPTPPKTGIETPNTAQEVINSAVQEVTSTPTPAQIKTNEPAISTPTVSTPAVINKNPISTPKSI